MKRLNTFIAALLLISSLWPTVSVAQSAPPTMPSNTVYGRLGAGTSGPGQAIPFATLLAQLSTVAGSNVGFITVPGVGLIPVAGAGSSVQLYASATGTDTNNYCTASGSPCTLKGACLQRSQIATFLVSTVRISVADGTYTATDGTPALCTIFGNAGGSSSALTYLVGDCSTPGAVVLSIPTGATGIFTKDSGETDISCMDINGASGSTGTIGIFGAQFSVADISSVRWGGTWGTGSRHIQATQSSSVNYVGNETILSNFDTHWRFTTGANLLGSPVTTCSGTLTFTTLLSVTAAVANLAGFTSSGCGSATGTKAILVAGYAFFGGTPCNTLLFGNSNCQLTNGFQDDANDTMAYGGTIDGPDGGSWSAAGGIIGARIASGASVLGITGVGYQTGAGAGGTVAQSTNKSTTVTLNTAAGQITMNNAALGAGTIVSFTLTDSAIAATDVLILNHISGGTVGSYTLNAQAAAGSATVNVRNNTAGSLSEAIVIQFALVKGSNN